MRKLGMGLAVALLCILIGYGYLFWQNNREVQPPKEKELRTALTKGIYWLIGHEEEIIAQSNPILWWMVQQSAELTQEPILEELFSKYRHRYLNNNPNNVWKLLFSPNAWVNIYYEDIAHFSYYGIHFIYALSCDQELGDLKLVQEQNDPDFCSKNYLLSPACTTHQLMGIRFMQRRRCGDQEVLAATVKKLQQDIVRQLSWDVRVVDVYVQRLLMLAESGAKAHIKPVWLQKALTAQLSDGGWASFQPLLPVSSTLCLGFSQKGIGVRALKSNFHTTAQGVFLMSLLLYDK